VLRTVAAASGDPMLAVGSTWAMAFDICDSDAHPARRQTSSMPSALARTTFMFNSNFQHASRGIRFAKCRAAIRDVTLAHRAK